MRVLLFHGYLLHGTGSNVYNASLAAALVRAGHEVHLVCQERDPLSLDWVDAAGDWDDGELRIHERRSPVGATIYRPELGGLLPVYVADRYEGTEARPFPELSDAEIDAYLAANVAAVREVAERVKPDAVLANHLIMGPVILARAGLQFAVKSHGSALEYVVRPHPERFERYAREGMAAARCVLVGSRHVAETLWELLPDLALEAKTRLGPPGVDVEAFQPRTPAQARAGLERLRERLASLPDDPAGGSSFARDPAEAVRALSELDLERDRLVLFVGKLIGSKGVELLLGAWPQVLAAEPRARLVIVGFGGERERLQALGAGLERVTWAGRLDHSELAELLPAAEALVVPSTFPEAFGMVAAEAAACGALPVVARHSGLAEVARTLAEVVPESISGQLAFDLGPSQVADLAACLTGWLGASPGDRAAARAAIVARTRERWSWEGVARTVLEAASGDLDALPSP